MSTNTTTKPAIGFVGLGPWAATWPPASSPPATPSTARSEAARTLTTSSSRASSGATRRARSPRPPRSSSHPCPTTTCSTPWHRGPDGILAGLAADQIWVDMSTVSPRASRELAERVRSQGAALLDAPVSGSVPQVQSGTLTIMVGGDEHAYARVEPVLRELGTPTHVGDNGQGLALKLAINISLAVQMLAFAEGLLLAERSGIDRRLAIDVMTQSPIGSPMLKARAPLVLDLPDEAWFDIGLMQKDIALALDAARQLEVPLPSAATADQMLTTARAMGYEQRDLAALFEVLAHMSTDGQEP